MRLALLLLVLLLPQLADAKGGAPQHKPNKDFRELIVKGERPEIAACMVAAVEDLGRDGSIRWDEQASDGALMRESEANGRLTRTVRFTAEVRAKGFAEDWRNAQITCLQPEDGKIQVSVKY